MKPKVFVGCSAESLQIAYAVQEELEYDSEVTLWPQNFFIPSSYPLDDLIGSLHRFDFAVFLFAADDTVKIRDVEHPAVRDNVLFELGLFLAHLGRERCFVVMPRGVADLRLPTDLLGISPLSFEPNREDGNLRAALGPACNRIRGAMREKGELRRFPAVFASASSQPSSHEERRRRKIESDLQAILDEATRSNTPASIVFADIDRFSSLNKWYGEVVCDEVLRVLENHLESFFSGAYKARIGGDQFLVCMKGKAASPAAREAVKFVRRVKLHDWAAIAPNLFVTVSVGVVGYNAGRPVQDWIVRAIQGSVNAKKSGGCRVSKGPVGVPAYLGLAYELMLS